VLAVDVGERPRQPVVVADGRRHRAVDDRRRRRVVGAHVGREVDAALIEARLGDPQAPAACGGPSRTACSWGTGPPMAGGVVAIGA
jgi:hypothetical protein